MSHDPDFGPRPRGRAGAQLGSRRTLLVVLAVTLVVIAAVLLLVRRGQQAPASCADGGSVACDFAAKFTVTGYHLTHRTVGPGRTAVASYYVGPPSDRPVELIAAPGLALSAPAKPTGTDKAPVVAVGASTDPAYAGCAVLVYRLATPPAGVVDGDDADGVNQGRLSLLEVGLTCGS